MDLDMFGSEPVKRNNITEYVKYHEDVMQGSDEWKALRCGILTASEMKLIITPTLKLASNDKEKAHLYELVSQRITGHVEEFYISDDMLRGHADEVDARILYHDNYAPVQEVGFITNDWLGFTIGYSPDGLVGDDGLIECKSRRQKYQIKTILECVAANTIPDEYLIQVQTGLLLTQRKWCDFISYCGGLEMTTIRVFPDTTIQSAIINSAIEFEKKIQDKVNQYHSIRTSPFRMIPTERRIEQEITL